MTKYYIGCQRPPTDPKVGDFIEKMRCWAVLSRHQGAPSFNYCNCENRARAGRLTCRHHARHEPDARKVLDEAIQLAEDGQRRYLAFVRVHLSPSPD